MKTLSFWKKSVYSALVFFGTVVVLSIGYSLVGNLSVADKVGTGSGLTVASWNKIVDGILDLDTRLSNITFSGNNVGIGVTPSAKLEVNGSTKLGTDAPAIRMKLINGTLNYTNPFYQDFTMNLPIGSSVLALDGGYAQGTYSYVSSMEDIGAGCTFKKSVIGDTLRIYPSGAACNSLAFKVLVTYQN